MSGDRFSVRTPAEAGAEIRELADQLGLRLGQFCTVALILGARQLSRSYAPEKYTIPAMLEAYKTTGVMSEEAFEKALQRALVGVFENPALVQNLVTAADADPDQVRANIEELRKESEG